MQACTHYLQCILLGYLTTKISIQKHQLEMWEKTNYPAQVAQMRKAGLNPALMYGQAGAGGQLGGTAPSGGEGASGMNPLTTAVKIY